MTRVAGRGRGDRGEHLGPGGRGAQRRRPALEHRLQIVVRMPLELVQAAARDERADDRVERVLGRGADQRHEPRLDHRQERVLLSLVEAVDLVDEEHGAPALRAQALARAADHRLDVGLARRDRRELLEGRLRARGDDARERRLARARRAEEDRRGHAVLLDRPSQGGALADELRLAGELVERARAHAVRERRVRCAPLLGRVVEQAHGGMLDVLEQAEPGRLARGVHARPAAERDQRVADVHVDRAHRQVQLGRDLAVRAPLGDAPDHLELPGREAGRSRRAPPRAAELGQRRARPPPAAAGRRACGPAGARRRATRAPDRPGRRRSPRPRR